MQLLFIPHIFGLLSYKKKKEKRKVKRFLAKNRWGKPSQGSIKDDKGFVYAVKYREGDCIGNAWAWGCL